MPFEYRSTNMKCITDHQKYAVTSKPRGINKIVLLINIFDQSKYNFDNTENDFINGTVNFIKTTIIIFAVSFPFKLVCYFLRHL
jgi:hypothetical protein